MSQEFAPVAERIIEALLESDPRIGAWAGDHQYDDRLPDLSAGAMDRRVATLREASDALAQIDPDTLEPAERVDHAILHSMVDGKVFEHTQVREHEWNPLEHNPGDLLHALIARPFAPPAQRLASLSGRLAAIPDALAVARDTLRDCPRIHLETAVGQFAGTAALIRTQVPELLAQVPGAGPAATALADQAVAALEEFGGWLRGQLADGAPGRDPRLGRPLWEARLWHTLDTEMPAATVLSRAQQQLDDVNAALREASARLLGVPASGADDSTVRAALDQLAQEHPDNESIVDLAKLTMGETTDFVRDNELVTLIDDPCVIEEMPEFARGVAVAYCDPPGPLETAPVPTFYCISPTPAGWTPQRVESFYREYNNHLIRNLTVHEAMPGHFLQLAHSRRYRGSTRTRALGFSSPMVEGWAVYAEEVMTSHGFGGLPLEIQRLKMQLRSALNAILDQLVHCADLSEADGMALMRERGYQEDGEAAGKWRRALLTSTQLSTYFVGYLEMSAIGRALPAGVSTRDWHDRMLAYGSPSPRHVRTLLGLAG